MPVSNSEIDTDALLRQAVADNAGTFAAFTSAAIAIGWLTQLATPEAWAVTQTQIGAPVRDFMIGMVDRFIEYARSGAHDTKPLFEPVPLGERVSRAQRLRALLQDWTPPELTDAISQGAHDVLHAEGLRLP